MELLAVLADPVRHDIVELLATRERTAGEIAGNFAVSGPAISRHLRVLRENGVATYRQDGQRRVYTLNPAKLAEVEAWARRLQQQWQRRFEALGQHLDHQAGQGEER